MHYHSHGGLHLEMNEKPTVTVHRSSLLSLSPCSPFAKFPTTRAYIFTIRQKTNKFFSDLSRPFRRFPACPGSPPLRSRSPMEALCCQREPIGVRAHAPRLSWCCLLPDLIENAWSFHTPGSRVCVCVLQSRVQKPGLT